MSGLRVGQVAEGQANKKICSIPKTGAGKDAMSLLGMLVLPRRRSSWPAEPRAVRTGTDCMGKFLFQWSWVMTVTDEERTFQNLDHIFFPTVPYSSP